MLKVQEIKELIRCLDQSSIHEFKYEQNGSKISMKKQGTGVALQETVSNPSQVASLEQTTQTVSVPDRTEVQTKETELKQEPKTEEAKTNKDASLYKIVSPMVGTFYSSPSPDSDPYIKVGDKLSENSVVCIVEAMKLMNEIEAEIKGEVVEILVENGQLVEYGQELILVKPE